MKRSNRTTRAHMPMPKLRIKSKNKLENAKRTSIDDHISEHNNMDDIDLFFEENQVEETGDSSTSNYILPSEPRESINNYQPQYSSLIDTIGKTSVNYDEFNISDMNSTYDNESLSDILDVVENSDDESDILDVVENSDDESDILEEALETDILEDMSSDFEGFNNKYGPYFSNFTSAMIFIWITKHMI
ncbi:7757_t:CDS:2, partial [Dentiscutata heterogama]